MMFSVIRVAANGEMALTWMLFFWPSAEVPIEPGRRGGDDDAAVVLLAHDLPDRLGRLDRAHQVDVDHEREVGDLHLREALVAEHAGVGDQDVDAAPVIHGVLDHPLDAGVVGDRRAVGDRLAAQRLDLLDHAVRSLRAAARTVDGAAQVVDHDLRAAPGELEGVLATEAAACAGDDGHFAVEADVRHEEPLLLRRALCGAARPASSRRGGRAHPCGTRRAWACC
jgi:hypothetical protein